MNDTSCKKSADPFFLLGLPRRPVIDRNLLEKNLRSLVVRYHPDQVTGNAVIFEKIQAATHLLRNTASRLRHLAGEMPPVKTIPLFAEELFSTIAAALADTKEKIAVYHSTRGVLAKALLINELVAAQRKLTTVQESLCTWQDILDDELQALDLSWPNVGSQELLSLASSFTFLTRWQEQLSEQIMEIKILIP